MLSALGLAGGLAMWSAIMEFKLKDLVRKLFDRLSPKVYHRTSRCPWTRKRSSWLVSLLF